MTRKDLEDFLDERTLEERIEIILQVFHRYNKRKDTVAEELLKHILIREEREIQIEEGIRKAGDSAKRSVLRMILHSYFGVKPVLSPWTEIIPKDIDTYPDEGVDVIVSDGKHYDVAYYLMSSDYKWMKASVAQDCAEEFEDFEPMRWKYIYDKPSQKTDDSDTAPIKREVEVLLNLKAPVGQFIMENTTLEEVLSQPDGAYYHYATVVRLLKEYKKS